MSTDDQRELIVGILKLFQINNKDDKNCSVDHSYSTKAIRMIIYASIGAINVATLEKVYSLDEVSDIVLHLRGTTSFYVEVILLKTSIAVSNEVPFTPQLAPQEVQIDLNGINTNECRLIKDVCSKFCAATGEEMQCLPSFAVNDNCCQTHSRFEIQVGGIQRLQWSRLRGVFILYGSLVDISIHSDGKGCSLQISRKKNRT